MTLDIVRHRYSCHFEHLSQLSQNDNEKIRKVDGAMAQEGMPLTKELKQKLYNCIIGKTTTEIERQKIINKYTYEKTPDYCYENIDVLIKNLTI